MRFTRHRSVFTEEPARAQHPRAVDQKIHPLHRLPGGLHGGGDLRLDAHIALEEGCADFARGRLAGCLLQVEQRGAPALADDALRDGAPQSGGAARDDRTRPIDPHFKLMVVFTPEETLPSSNQREVMVLVWV